MSYPSSLSSSFFFFFFYGYGAHRDLHVLTHSFPTRRSSDLGIRRGYCLRAASPLPMLVAIVQVVTRAGEFSLGKPGRETLYTRVDRESRYKAKAVIDTVIYRGADLTFVWLHKAVALLGSTMVFATGIAVAAAMTAAAWGVVRSQRELPDDPAAPPPGR